MTYAQAMSKAEFIKKHVDSFHPRMIAAYWRVKNADGQTIGSAYTQEEAAHLAVLSTLVDGLITPAC